MDIAILNDLASALGFTTMNFTVAALIGFMGGVGAKKIILKFFPKLAPVLMLFSGETQQLLDVIDHADGEENKNEDLRKWAMKNGLKLAASLIRK